MASGIRALTQGCIVDRKSNTDRWSESEFSSTTSACETPVPQAATLLPRVPRLAVELCQTPLSFELPPERSVLPSPAARSVPRGGSVFLNKTTRFVVIDRRLCTAAAKTEGPTTNYQAAKAHNSAKMAQAYGARGHDPPIMPHEHRVSPATTCRRKRCVCNSMGSDLEGGRIRCSRVFVQSRI